MVKTNSRDSDSVFSRKVRFNDLFQKEYESSFRLDKDKKLKILEIGCGPGALAAYRIAGILMLKLLLLIGILISLTLRKRIIQRFVLLKGMRHIYHLMMIPLM